MHFSDLQHRLLQFHINYSEYKMTTITLVKTPDAVVQDKHGATDAGLGQLVAAREAIYGIVTIFCATHVKLFISFQ